MVSNKINLQKHNHQCDNISQVNNNLSEVYLITLFCFFTSIGSVKKCLRMQKMKFENDSDIGKQKRYKKFQELKQESI